MPRNALPCGNRERERDRVPGRDGQSLLPRQPRVRPAWRIVRRAPTATRRLRDRARLLRRTRRNLCSREPVALDVCPYRPKAGCARPRRVVAEDLIPFAHARAGGRVFFETVSARRPDALIRYGNDRAVWRNLTSRFPHPYTREAADNWIQIANAHPADTCNLAIVVGDETVGAVGF